MGELQVKYPRWVNDLGLLKRWKGEITPENTFLFGLHYYLMSRMAGAPSKEMEASLITYLDKAVEIDLHTGYVWYKNHILDEEIKLNPYTSHDQLTAYCVFSKLFKMDHHSDIWKVLKRRLFTYDNISKKINFRRFIHPRDILYIGMLNNSPICWLLSPLFYLIGCFTFIRHRSSREHLIKEDKFARYYDKKVFVKNSNEMLFWVRSFALKGVLKYVFFRVYSYCVVKRFGSIYGLISHYYHDDITHPTLDLMQHVKEVRWG